jgi:hypothetical protein
VRAATAMLAHEIVALRTALKADPLLEDALRGAIAAYVRGQGISLSDALAAELVLAVPAETEAIRSVAAAGS